MKIIEFAFVGYPVTDLARARAFYEGVLGLTPGSVWEDAENQRGWYEYEIGPHCLAITNMDMEQWKPSNQGAGVALEVDDFDEAVAHLKAKQVKISSEPVETKVCRMMLIEDPDGNTICIHKRHPDQGSPKQNIATHVSLG